MSSSTHSETLIRKAASDAGFDLDVNDADDWFGFAVSGAPIRAWVRDRHPGLYVAVSSSNVLKELDRWPREDRNLPAGAVGGILCNSYEDLLAALTRARILDATLPDRLHERWKQRLASVSTTETEAVVRQRIGQDLFREGLMDYWEGRCAVTELDVPELLRASHAKPWRDASDQERLDVHNGLLLAVHLDALFDKGYLTFDDSGNGVVSQLLPVRALDQLGLPGTGIRLRKLSAGNLPYLKYHRDKVFRAR
jgi:hypothetical protein